jgi:YihY family inner membrane protein
VSEQPKETSTGADPRGATGQGRALRGAAVFSSPRACAAVILQRPGHFALRVLRAFKRNQGMLLSGAVAYYMMLSIIPVMLLLLIGLSNVVPEDQLLETVRSDVGFIIPAAADTVVAHLEGFLANRHLVGWVGFLVLVFFATTAFTVLENAMSVIFFHRVAVHRRHFLVSALIPFLFIALIGIGLLVITLISGAMQALDDEHVRFFGREWGLEGASAAALYLTGVVGLVLLMTGLYLVMPLGRIALRHALIGGLVAAVLWEISRHLLVWYFKTLSLVNLIYGSFAGAVVVLLSFEVAALILLLGAQVIAEFERCSLQGGDDPGSGFNT